MPRPLRPATHRCYAPGCDQQVGMRLLMCKPHWYAVPKPLRDAIWDTYNQGRGVRSEAYRQNVREAQRVLGERKR